MPIKVRYFLTHPIQYFSPLLRRLAGYRGLELEVIYLSDSGARNYFDPGFSQELAWDVSPLEGYKYQILCPGKEIKAGFFSVPSGRVSSQIRKKTTDAAVIHGWGNFFYLAATLSALRKNIPVLYRTEINEFYDQTIFRNLSALELGLRKIKPALLALLFKRISGFLAIGSLNRKYYLNRGVPLSRIFPAPYSVDDSRFKAALVPPGERNSAEKKLGLNPGSFRVLFCGKLIRRKRPADIIEAVSRVSSKDRFEIIFIGDGELLPELRNLAREKAVTAHFPGFVNQQSLPLYYSLGHVLVLPSQNEPWGLVVNEAMAMGLPVMVSDMVGCGPDLVIEGRSGFIFPTGNAEVLAGFLERLHGSRELQEGLGQGAREIIADYSLDRTAEKYWEAIESVLTQAPSSPRAIAAG